MPGGDEVVPSGLCEDGLRRAPERPGVSTDAVAIAGAAERQALRVIVGRGAKRAGPVSRPGLVSMGQAPGVVGEAPASYFADYRLRGRSLAGAASTRRNMPNRHGHHLRLSHNQSLD